MLYENSSAHLVYRLLPTINTNIAENVPCKVNKYRYISGYRLGTLFVKLSVTKNELLRTRYCTVLYCMENIGYMCRSHVRYCSFVHGEKSTRPSHIIFPGFRPWSGKYLRWGDRSSDPPPPPFPIDPYYITLYQSTLWNLVFHPFRSNTLNNMFWLQKVYILV